MSDPFGWLHEDQMRQLIDEVTDFAGLDKSKSEGMVMGQRFDDGAVLVTIAIAPKKVLDKAKKKA